MSKKSVVIALPRRAAAAGAAEPREADSWVKAEVGAAAPRASGIVDLLEDRNPFELAWLLWTFPARATWYWMAKATGQPRPR